MWIVKLDVDASGSPSCCVIHIDSIMHAAHLIGVYGNEFLPHTLTFDGSLDVFHTHHIFEIAY